MRRALVTLLLCAAGVASTGCDRFGGGRDAVADAGGGPTGNRRIVSVSKQINEFLFAIGAQSQLVGVDISSIYPPAIRSLPTVGYHRALSAEGILSLRPTLFLTDGNVGPDAVMEELKKVGLDIEVLEPGSTVADAQDLMAKLGSEFGRENAADSVISHWRSDMQSVWADTARWSDSERPRVLIIHFGQIVNDYLAVKAGGPADAMVRWAGGRNAVDSVGGMMRLTPELLARTAPDIILATDLGFDRFGSADAFAKMPGVSLTPAGRNGRIYRVEETALMYFGPRTPATVRLIRGFLHPDAD